MQLALRMIDQRGEAGAEVHEAHPKWHRQGNRISAQSQGKPFFVMEDYQPEVPNG